MPLEIGALLFEGVRKIVFAGISKRVVLAGEAFLTRRRIESRVDDSIAQVVEQLLPFFESEHLSDHQRQVLISNCTHELSEIIEDPREIFAASLDGQKVFDRRYTTRRLPQGIRDEGLEDLYAMVFPQIANLVCIYPPAIEQWRIEGYKEGFRRLDDIATTLGGVANKLDQLTSKESETADVLLTRVRQSLAQRVEFLLDLTGLRGDRPDAVPLEKCFIAPELLRRTKDEKEIRISEASDVRKEFSCERVRAIVIGPPGSGKSTWSRWVQREQLMNGEPRLAVLVRLRELIKTHKLPSHHQLVRDAAGTHLSEEIDPNVCRKWCKLGTITFILDGFDEVPTNQRDGVLSWIKDLSTAAENAGLILTSRPLTSNHLAKLSVKWLRWEITPFDQPRITDYISKWYAHAPLLAEKQRDVDAEELARRWLADFALRPLVGIPLMLATIVMVHHMDGKLPQGRAKLYERYVQGMLGLWDSRWGIPSEIELSLDLKNRILTKLAVQFHLEAIEQMGDEEVDEVLDTILPIVGCSHSATTVLDYLRERTGLLIGPGTWSFVHKNVAEFLVAAAIRDGDYVATNGETLDRLRLFSERHNDRWNTVLFFWAGLTAPGDLRSFVDRVLSDSGPGDLILALSLIYDQLQPERLTEPWRSERILDVLKKGLDPDERHPGGFICGPLPLDLIADVPADVPRLRTPERTTLRTAIWESLSVSTLGWSEVAICHDSLLFITWSFFSTRPRNSEDLSLALDPANWPKHLPSEWLMFPPTWGFRSAAENRCGVSLAEFVDTLGQLQPTFKRRIPFFLLGSLILMIFKENIDLDANAVRVLLLQLQSVQADDADEEWLALTDNFVEDSFGKLEPFDLLERSNDALNRLAQVERRLGPDLLAKCRELVANLMDRREKGRPQLSLFLDQK